MTDEAPKTGLQPPTPPPGTVKSEERLRELIRTAFESARSTGRSDWQQMTVAVLKNRLLNLTNRAFNERDYGSPNISDLIRRLPDLLILDQSTTPPTVRLLPSNVPVGPPIVTEGSRIRRDLWEATMDYRSQQPYVWDGVLARKLEQVGDDQAGLVMPTLTEAEMDTWRADFITANSAIIEHDQALVARAIHWRDERLGTVALPGELRSRWNVELKRRVIAHLTRWFADQGIPAPTDLLQPTRPKGSREVPAVDTNDLRDLVLRCVRVMTDDELRQLSLPPAAVLRAGR